MSSIYGYIGFETESDKVQKQLKHWQPDREDCFVDDEITIGALELFNTPESPLQAQPLHYKQWVVVADCRIDNRLALNKELNIDQSKQFSDIQYIAFAFEKWKYQCLEHLEGDFAFAVWDKGKKELFIGRDHLGIRPIYYSIDEKSVAFASEIKGITAHQEIDKSINKKRIVSYFSPHDTSFEQTIYEHIYLLQAGHYLVWKKEAFFTKQYWKLGSNKIKIPLDREDQEMRFNELVQNSVKKRLRSYRKVGGELSGGLDSTGLAGIAMNILGKGSEFYSYAFAKPEESIHENDKKDDTDVVHEFCNTHNIEDYCSIVNEKDISLQQYLDTYCHALDEPDSNGIPMMATIFLTMAKKQGVGMLFSGWGGDQMLTCKRSSFANGLSRQKKYKALWEDLKRTQPQKNTLYLFLVKMIKGVSSLKLQRRLNKKMQDHYDKSVLKEEYVRDYLDVSQPNFAHEIKHLTNYKDYFSYMLIRKPVQERIVSHITLGRHFNIDYRFPMLDVPLLEYLYSLPVSTISPLGGQSRYLFRKFVTPFVPKKVSEEHKSHVGSVPFSGAFFTMVKDELLGMSKTAYHTKLNRYLQQEKLFEEERIGHKNLIKAYWLSKQFEKLDE